MCKKCPLSDSALARDSKLAAETARWRFLQDGCRSAPRPRWWYGEQGVHRPHSWPRLASHDRILSTRRIGTTNAKAAYIHHAGPAANLPQLTAVSTVVASAGVVPLG